MSTAGAGVAPTLQAASVSAAVSKMISVRRGNFRTSIFLPPWNFGQNDRLEAWCGLCHTSSFIILQGSMQAD
jgi:hypothetical protein